MIGFRILERKRKVADLVVRQFRDIPVANISDSMSRITAGGARLRPMHGGGAMAGPAFTVKTRPEHVSGLSGPVGLGGRGATQRLATAAGATLLEGDPLAAADRVAVGAL